MKADSQSKSFQVLKQIEELSEHHFLPIIGPAKGQVLADTIRKIKPTRALEVGTLIGYSAILMGKELPKNAEIITIEINAADAKIAEENIRKSKIQSKVKVVIGDAISVIPTLKGIFDLVFIDAEKTEYLEYLRLIEGKLHKGTVVVADNAGIFADQMKNYLEYVRASGKYKSKYLAFGDDGVEVSVRL